ncbi:MAG: 1-acyl-sn-glycerol-3-phosphate acyltransferase [Actinobacteria bacterium]|nr:1-acyl-sn-glycerol-3-phosphate acyltransferase [Actinomycetota bacterium]
MDINQLLLYETIRFFIGPMMKFHLRLKIEGQENVPDNGAAVIACNHRSTMDPIILGYSVRNRYISFGAAAWSYKVPVYGHFHRAIGAFPLTLTGGEKSGDELNRGLELLNEGEIVGIFPEGGETIFDPGKVEKITPFKTGFARLALEARVPVIPVAIIGSGERRLPTVPGPVVEKVVKHPKREKGYSSVIYKRARCRIGLPLDLGDLYDNPINKKLLDLVTSKVRQIVMKLYNGEDLERFMTGEVPFDFAYERIGGPTKKLL